MLCKERILPRDLGNSINMEKEQRPALGREGIAVLGAGAAESWGEGKAEMGRMMGGGCESGGLGAACSQCCPAALVQTHYFMLHMHSTSSSVSARKESVHSLNIFKMTVRRREWTVQGSKKDGRAENNGLRQRKECFRSPQPEPRRAAEQM